VIGSVPPRGADERKSTAVSRKPSGPGGDAREVVGERRRPGEPLGGGQERGGRGARDTKGVWVRRAGLGKDWAKTGLQGANDGRRPGGGRRLVASQRGGPGERAPPGCPGRKRLRHQAAAEECWGAQEDPLDGKWNLERAKSKAGRASEGSECARRGSQSEDARGPNMRKRRRDRGAQGGEQSVGPRGRRVSGEGPGCRRRGKPGESQRPERLRALRAEARSQGSQVEGTREVQA